jgi:hypothetical protein
MSGSPSAASSAPFLLTVDGIDIAYGDSQVL